MEIHEAADIFPMEQETIGELASDIRNNGQVKPIELYQGKVIDGRRRLKACEFANVEPKMVDVTASVTDPTAYVLSLNLHRRHLDASQKAIIAARVRAIYDKEAKERQKANLKKGNETPVQAKMPERESARQSRDAAGAAVSRNRRGTDAPFQAGD